MVVSPHYTLKTRFLSFLPVSPPLLVLLEKADWIRKHGFVCPELLEVKMSMKPQSVIQAYCASVLLARVKNGWLASLQGVAHLRLSLGAVGAIFLQTHLPQLPGFRALTLLMKRSWLQALLCHPRPLLSSHTIKCKSLSNIAP